MKCPRCGSSESFSVTAWELQISEWFIVNQGPDFEGSPNKTRFDVNDTKTGDIVESGIYPASEARCLECGVRGEIETFDDGSCRLPASVSDGPITIGAFDWFNMTWSEMIVGCWRKLVSDLGMFSRRLLTH